jgi:hypothetical protein
MSEGSKAEKLYLHIGTEKTGSTTLQRFGYINRHALQKRGICYPNNDRGIKLNASLPGYASAVTLPPEASRIHTLDGPDSLAQFRQDMLAQLKAQLQASGCNTLWLSNERLSAYIRGRADIERMASLANALADSVKIVIYLRDQADLCVSAYSTLIKAGGDGEMRPPISGRAYYYDYSRMISAWAEVFGRESIIVRVFDRRSLIGGDVIDDFLSVLGIEDHTGFVREPDANTSLDANALQFLRLFNRHVARVEGHRINPNRGRIAQVLSEMSGGPRLTVPAEVATAIRSAYAASNAEVARTYLGREDGILFPPPKGSTDAAAPKLTVEAAVEIAAKLWVWQQTENSKVKGRGTQTLSSDAEGTT